MNQYQNVFQRVEKKYLLDAGQFAALGQALQGRTVPDAYPSTTICSLYYDTADYALIRASLQKPDFKEKLRLRSYGVPGREELVFAELKRKVRGVVYKRRAPLPLQKAESYLGQGVPAGEENQVLREISQFLRVWRPAPRVLISYERTALCARGDGGLRITFDRGIRWRGTCLGLAKGDWGSGLLPPGQVLMEVKLPGAMPLWLCHALSALGIFPTSFSKYGACYQQHLARARREGGDICA